MNGNITRMIWTPHGHCRHYKDFYGKGLSEAFEMFVENALNYQEDIMFMPLPCFQYYVHAYIDYLLSEKSKGDSDGASCFFGVVEIREADIRASSDELRLRISDLLRHIGKKQDWYAALPEVYGDFAAKTNEALDLIEKEMPNHRLEHDS